MPARSGFPRLRIGSTAGWACALAIVALLAYWRAPGTEFIGDDDGRITAGEQLLKQGLWTSVATILPDRPLLTATVFFNYALGGLNPWGYKVFSLVLHVGVGLVFFVLLLRLQKQFFRSADPVLPALFAAVFLVHPLNTQAVLSSIQRGVILAALGGLGTFLFFLEYLRSRARVFILLALLCYTLGMLSKSFVVAMSLIILLYLRLCGEPLRPLRWLMLPVLAISVLPVIPYHFWGVNRQDGSAVLSWTEYLLAQTRVVWIYLKLFLIPTKLHFYYDFDQDSGWLRQLTWLAIAGHAALLAAAALLVRRRRLLAGFGIFAMYLAFVPESGVFPIYHLAFEHRAYFPMLFLLLALFALSRSIPGAARSTAAILLPVIGVFAVATSARIEQVDTLEKWVVDAYRYRAPTRANNIQKLNLLIAETHRPLAKRFCREMIDRDPDYVPYRLYDGMFTYRDASAPRQIQTLELMANSLMNEQSAAALDPQSVKILASFVVSQTAQKAPDPIVREQALEPLFRSLLLRFLGDTEMFHDLIVQHKSNLAQLMRHYEQALGKGELPERDFVQYLNVLGQLTIYFPKSLAEIDALCEHLKRDAPGRAALVDGAGKSYRELRRVLKITTER